MGMTKRTFYTRKHVLDFLHRTEQKAKENAKKAVEDYVAASKQAEQSIMLLQQQQSQISHSMIVGE
jgi:hypothetical protein